MLDSAISTVVLGWIDISLLSQLVSRGISSTQPLKELTLAISVHSPNTTESLRRLRGATIVKGIDMHWPQEWSS